MGSIDLTDAYYTVPVAKEHRTLAKWLLEFLGIKV